MKRNHHFLFMAIVLVVTVSSCVPDGPGDGVVMDDPLDIELQDVLDEQGGVDYFTLPMSNDYNSIPQDPNNPISSEKIALGKKLFYETGLALNPLKPVGTETYSCSTCHVPGSGFQAGIRQGIGDGGMGIGIGGEGRIANPIYEEYLLDIPPIRVPNNMNTAYIVNATWNGKLGATGANVGTESLWVGDIFLETNNLGYTGVETQAIAGLEFHRMVIDPVLVSTTYYKDLFDYAFADYPISERYTFETAGLAIAAFERSMMTNRAPFQDWLRGDPTAMTEDQKLGALLFFDEAGCSNCHTGPALNSNTFHAIGVGELEGEGVLGDFSEITASISKGRGGFTLNPVDDYKFKTPQLYNLKSTNFLGHGATFTSVRDIIEYKNNAIPENTNVPISQLSPDFVSLGLTSGEIDLLVDFIENGLFDAEMDRYVTEAIASGNCFPNNDPQSQADMGCQ